MDVRVGELVLHEDEGAGKENGHQENGRKEPRYATIAAQAGFCQEGNAFSGTKHGKAIFTASVYEFETLEELRASTYSYRRLGNPNSDDLAHALACLESAESGLATSSGMGAVVATVLGLLKGGDTVFVHGDTYGGTFSFFEQDVRRFGIHVEMLDVMDVLQLDSALARWHHQHQQQLEGRNDDVRALVFCESITNPLIRVADVPGMSAVCRKHGALLVVDNTFGTPLRRKPLLQGANIVVHSATKFIGGHSDLIAGAVVGPAKLVDRARGVAHRWGLTISPFDAWLCTRSIRTLQVRMERAWVTAERLAERVAAEERAVVRVHAAPQCAVFSFEVAGGAEGASRVFDKLSLIKIAPSLGGVTTTVSHPATSSHVSLGAAERARLGIPDGLIRISVGVEDVEDLAHDLLPAVRAAVCHV
ncbi:hypothetical protein MPTK1_6g16160 [Marchantia polymorpha subsp. ruderalis]|uniref:Cystathionine gamma-synthase n=2 Tax=Marchantia polymorpha TaxID=3197 RepID=A0A176WBY8_MARPO|nr:hypothetical protein AXG93_4295s1180 [Marchantia polymorpha subsp. ruderalis]PTQ37683.1 hypothetical protein MARPO_0056s0126 [Marchantia polymorpha]BBN14999.1 hypothetical protein Mp_6g16160 [Marchantia polymorpha subsp. ruderalis]|eukprot:PTQ37683.1 hypothetical protein MARPO_0056s0126 [Marchantia polymorpha]